MSTKIKIAIQNHNKNIIKWKENGKRRVQNVKRKEKLSTNTKTLNKLWKKKTSTINTGRKKNIPNDRKNRRKNTAKKKKKKSSLRHTSAKRLTARQNNSKNKAYYLLYSPSNIKQSNNPNGVKKKVFFSRIENWN